VRRLTEQASVVWRDVRQSARVLVASPAYTLVSVVSIALGLALVTTVYCEYRSTLFRPIPGVTGADSLVTILQPVSYPSLEEFRDHGGQFSSLAAYQGPVAFVLRNQAAPERVWGQIVSPDYFTVLGVRCAIGRAFVPGDADLDTGVVISDRLWRRRFAADPTLPGHPIRLGGRMVTVMGVAPPGFLGASPMMLAADIFVATTADENILPELARDRVHDPGRRTFFAVGRLRPDITIERAEAALDAIARRLDEQRGEHLQPGGRRILLAPGGTLFPVRKQDLPLLLSFPLALVAITLWVGCTNVATMSLARVVARRRETAVRLALGASRARIVRQLLTESVMLSLMAAAAGCALSYWALGAFDRLKPLMPGYMDFQILMDGTALALAAAVAAGAGLAFGLLPAARAARTPIASGLSTGAYVRVSGYRWLSVRNFLVLQQVAGSLTLLLLTGFIILGFQRSTSLDMGFDTRGLSMASLDPQRDGYTPEATADLLEKLEQRLRVVPGIRALAYAQGSPLGALGEMAQTKVRLVRDPETLVHRVKVEHVAPRYFETLGIPVLLGRAFTTAEADHGAKVAIVNETMAQGFGTGAAVLGRTVDIDGEPNMVIGVAKDVRGIAVLRLAESVAYVPLETADRRAAGGITVLLRAEPGVDARAEIRKAAQALDPDLAIFDVLNMTEQVQQTMSMVRVVTFVYGGIGVFGLALAAIGLGGVTAYSVARRRKEIGIRIALGARATDVLRVVLREGAVLVVAGTVVGQLAAMGIGRALGGYIALVSQALQTSLSDPLLLVGAPLLLAGVTMLACWFPARRAIRIDPVTTLREE
jgi:macrolide transport system ATP-binding/permease protein